ncbi:MAG: hypothetical protein RL208_584 [Pseudomonadota bacterium]|jgi:glutamate-5-semialdehyde dehydrogenase
MATQGNSDIQIIKNNSYKLLELSNQQICDIITEVKEELLNNIKEIIIENEKDLKNFAEQNGQNHPNYDRLMLNEVRIKQIANEMENVANFPFNTEDNIIKEYQSPVGLNIQKISVPLGTIGVIYESRPNVTVDVFTLCFRSQNACILKGGKEAHHSNTILVNIINSVLKKHNLEDTILLLKPEREEIARLITAEGLVDVCIPRGGKNLINFVRKNATVPVIETGAGVVHLYFAESGNIEIAKKVIVNSKTRRVSVCNALDTVLIHKSRVNDITKIASKLIEKNVTILADETIYEVLKNANYPLLQKAKEEDYYTEFLDYKIAIKTVDNVKEAIEHIMKHTSNHTECIISENKEEIETFTKMIDSSVVYVNTSTCFTDGAQFGLGSEIGISTQKLHARGPMGIESLRTIKYIVKTEGLTRS